jgi:hypothetical protein
LPIAVEVYFTVAFTVAVEATNLISIFLFVSFVLLVNCHLCGPVLISTILNPCFSEAKINFCPVLNHLKNLRLRIHPINLVPIQSLAFTEQLQLFNLIF